MTVYFQHWTGDLRWMYLSPEGKWVGGTKSETIAGNAKNSTPISAVAYMVNATAVWHIFYISKDGYVKERMYSNTTSIWQDGPLSDLNLKTYNKPNVGLQACWYGNYYGDNEISKTGTVPYNTPGMHLWYPTDDSTFEQYGWYLGKDQWQEQKKWTGMNAHAGVGCYSWGPTNTTYAMMVNKHNTVEVWWKDTDKNAKITDEHPVNSWANASRAGIPNVYPSTSLGYTSYFYTQMQDGSVMGRNMTWAAENTTVDARQTFTVGDAKGTVLGLKGTHLSVTSVENKSGGTNLYVFYQTKGDDLTVFTRDITGGQWTSSELLIPSS
ncbi:hypothetical protein CC80DRAFT_426916 [Byssothecium circinans]|uniref:Fucose-specific lectin n=1 Tax=Byssothecium circinans TaxID=147558 RepID=A0A6A5TND1_9PLEO|nr:hypothetical protein CC80DRAFT_426916 [Byssothecium circinans]